METPSETETLVAFDEELQFEDGIWICNAYIKHFPDDGDDQVWIDFHTYHVADIQDARKIFVHTIEKMLDRLDSAEKLGPYRWNDDYTVEDLYVSMEFKSFFGRYVDPKYVGRMELKKGELVQYYANTGFDDYNPCFHFHSEPYKTSVRIVKTQDRITKQREADIPDLPDYFETDIFPSTFTNYRGPPEVPAPPVGIPQ